MKHLKPLAIDKGFKDAWANIVDPWLAQHPGLKVQSGGAAEREERWTAPATVRTASTWELTTESGRELAELNSEVQEVRADLRRVLAQISGNATNKSTGPMPSARPLWAAPAEAPEVQATGAEPHAIAPAPPVGPKVEDNLAGELAIGAPRQFKGYDHGADSVAGGRAAPSQPPSPRQRPLRSSVYRP